MIGQDEKLKMIWKIDEMQNQYPNWKRVELNTLRSKYIYKDISINDYIKDLRWLKMIDGDWKDNYYYYEYERLIQSI